MEEEQAKLDAQAQQAEVDWLETEVAVSMSQSGGTVDSDATVDKAPISTEPVSRVSEGRPARSASVPAGRSSTEHRRVVLPLRKEVVAHVRHTGHRPDIFPTL